MLVFDALSEGVSHQRQPEREQRQVYGKKSDEVRKARYAKTCFATCVGDLGVA